MDPCAVMLCYLYTFVLNTNTNTIHYTKTKTLVQVTRLQHAHAYVMRLWQCCRSVTSFKHFSSLSSYEQFRLSNPKAAAHGSVDL